MAAGAQVQDHELQRRSVRYERKTDSKYSSHHVLDEDALDDQVPITKWPHQSGAPVGAAPPTRSQYEKQRSSSSRQTTTVEQEGYSILCWAYATLK